LKEIRVEALAVRILIFVLVVLASLGGGYLKGRSDANSGWEKKALEMETASQRKLAEVTSQVRKVEFEAQESLSALSAKHSKETKDAKAKSDRVLSDVRAGAYRLSVPALRCRDAEALYPTTPRGDRTEARAELAAEAAATLVSIAAEGDDAIRQLNACISAYNDIRERFNK